MDINKLLSGVDCLCGKYHTCNIDYVYIEDNAINRLTEICDDNDNILIVCDENTYKAAGEKTEKVLSDKTTEKIIFSGAKVLVPDEIAVNTVMDRIAGIDLIIGIGSGVIQDLCKYVSSLSGIPYIIVATAPSMDGYASDGAAMIMGGMKVTYPAGLPRAIIADTEVLKNAPIDMIKAGFGDIVGKYSALNDWKLSHLVNGEYFCDYIYNLTLEQTEKTLALAQGILIRDKESIKTLMEALVVIGILMSFAGSSRPASGSEHHLSHFFEITGLIDGTEYLPHGIDVAFSTVITAKIRESLVESKFKETLYRPSAEEYRNKMLMLYKSVAEGCISLQKNVGNYSDKRLEVYIEKEKEIKKILSEMPRACKIEEILKTVGLDTELFYKHYSQEKIENAVMYAKDLKDRYTVLWLNYDLFGDEKNV